MVKSLFTLNPNRKQRLMGFFFLAIYIGIITIYLFYDGWIYEWLAYGYDGKSQHFDFHIFSDMQWTLENGIPTYTSTNNLHNLIYMCLWTGLISVFALLTGNKWLRQGSVATLAFPIMSAFSTINPIVANEIFTTDIFVYHSFFLQIVYDINHSCGIVMGVYNYYMLNKDEEEINIKQMAPTILFTWVLFILSRFLLQKWPFWDPSNRMGMISTNQINDMPFFLYGFEYIIVVALIFAINIALKKINPVFKNKVVKTFFPFVIFAGLTILFVFSGLIVLQDIPAARFIQ